MSIPALVTERIKPIQLEGNTVHSINLTVYGSSLNHITHDISDVNTGTPEQNTFLVNIRKGV